jgi:hypothetical protein
MCVVQHFLQHILQHQSSEARNLNETEMAGLRKGCRRLMAKSRHYLTLALGMEIEFNFQFQIF